MTESLPLCFTVVEMHLLLSQQIFEDTSLKHHHATHDASCNSCFVIYHSTQLPIFSQKLSTLNLANVLANNLWLRQLMVDSHTGGNVSRT